jgi:2-iminobutanoate/2-iminopropanoate deaminase
MTIFDHSDQTRSLPSPAITSASAAPETKKLGLPFSAAVRVGDMLYLSGALGNLPDTLKLADGGMAGEARQTIAQPPVHYLGRQRPG